MFTKILLCLVSLAFAGTVAAAEPTVTFSDMHARPTAAKVGMAFFTVTSNANDTITGIKGGFCKAVELHRTDKINGVMSMRRIATLDLKKNVPVRIQPDAKGGEHLMFIGLNAPLVEGDSLKVTFTFAKAPPQTVTFPVTATVAKSSVHELH